MNEDPTRPISVAELLARNGTIGSPPVSGHRRKKRRNAVSVAELTGEIPVTRTGELPQLGDATGENLVIEEDESAADDVQPDASATVIRYSSATVDADDSLRYTDTTPDYTPDFVEAGADGVPGAADSEQPPVAIDVVTAEPDSVEPARPLLEEPDEPEEPAPGKPPRSGFPLPRRRFRGPERSHDPRPRRRSPDAEQMNFDPVDESLDLAELVAEQAPEAEELRSYLQSSSGTLFSGETVADDIARRGLVESDDHKDVVGNGDSDDNRAIGQRGTAARPGAVKMVWGSAVAILQSLLAVVLGAALFVAFDQLWQWNNIVALALSTLVIVTLVIGVHVVRKTEDFVSILIAVAVGILVTFGPLALQSS